MAELLDILCLAILGGWAYLVAKRTNRDEVGWLMVTAAVFFILGLAASKAVFPRLLKQGAFKESLGPESLLDKTFDDDSPNADSEEFKKQKALQQKQKNWQTASGFIVGVPAGIIVNLILTLFLKPLPAPQQKPPGGPQAPGGPAGGTPEGGPTPEAPDTAGGQPHVQGMAVAGGPPAAGALGPEALLAQFWPVLIPLALFAAVLIPPVASALSLKPASDDPTKDLRFFLLVPVMGLLFWRLRGRPVEGVLAALFTLIGGSASACAS
jgi:hypothetical protein